MTRSTSSFSTFSILDDGPIDIIVFNFLDSEQWPDRHHHSGFES